MDAMVLIDQPEDAMCDERGWVETTVSEGQARDLLVPFCFDGEEDSPVRPCGEARRVWLRVTEPGPHADEDRWYACESTDSGAREFYEFDAQDVEKVAPNVEHG